MKTKQAQHGENENDDDWSFISQSVMIKHHYTVNADISQFRLYRQHTRHNRLKFNKIVFVRTADRNRI